jgi:nitrogen fixation protein NifB
MEETEAMTLDLTNHPCFNERARQTAARIHLPVAPRCNVQCNFCDRRFDCLNESRPGVTSAVLTPQQAVYYLDRAVEKSPAIRVVGIAGPGDPFASPDETLETLKLVRNRYPEMLLCVASNGLEVAAHAGALAKLQVSHVTLTVNAIDPEIGARIYAWVRAGIRVLRGVDAAALLLERQLAAIVELKRHGIVVKINTIVMPGINDEHAADVAREVSALGANIMNCIPMYPVAGTPFESLGELDHAKLAGLRRQTAVFMPQMLHCTRCRADAVGLLGEAQNTELIELLQATAAGPANPNERRPYVAISSHEGVLINQHVGEASRFWVFEPQPDGPPILVATRDAPEAGGGATRWYELAELLQDCKAVFTSAVGQTPRRILETQGIKVIEAVGVASDAIAAWNSNGQVPRGMQKLFQGCGRGCAGPGTGCG